MNTRADIEEKVEGILTDPLKQQEGKLLKIIIELLLDLREKKTKLF